MQTLSLIAIYEGICSGENSIEITWALMGLACKLSQSASISNLGNMRLIFTRACSRLASVRENFRILPFLFQLIDSLAADSSCARRMPTPAKFQKRYFGNLFISGRSIFCPIVIQILILFFEPRNWSTRNLFTSFRRLQVIRRS